MYKTITKILFVLFIFSGLLSCKKPPEYPLEPIISQYEENEITKGNFLTIIKIKLAFTDGDGNIGLEDADTLEPYQAYDVVYDFNGNRIFFDDSLDIFNIYDFAAEDYNDDGKLDTFKITPNRLKNNILFDFVRISPLDGSVFDTIDFTNIGTVGVERLDGRIEPLYKKDFSDEVYEGPIDGVIEYDLSSSFFLLPSGQYQVLVRIVDRDLNISNSILTTPKFTKD